VLLTENTEEERVIAKAIRDRVAAKGKNSNVDFIAAGADLVPTQQAEKQAVLKDLGEILSEIKLSWLDKEQRPLFKQATTMTKAEPWTKADLPVEVQRQFKGINGKDEEGF